MLVLTRRVGEAIWVHEGLIKVVIEVVSVHGKEVRLGFKCEENVRIDRPEAIDKKKQMTVSSA